MAYHIQRFCPEDLPTLTRLLDRSFSIQNPAKNALIRWKFFDAYHEADNCGGTITYLAMDDDGQAVAQYSNVPVTIGYGRALLDGMICTDMTTDPDHRGKGLISQLARCVYAEVRQRGIDLSIGFSNEAGVQVDKHADGYGYTIAGKFERYVKIIGRRHVSPYQLVPVTRFESDIEPGYISMFHLDKSPAFLNWRYLRKPNHDYQTYVLIHDNHNVGYVVLRLSTNRCYVYDIITAHIKHYRDILAAIHNTILAQGRHLAVYYVLDNPFWRSTLAGCWRIPHWRGQTNYYLTLKQHGRRIFLDKLLPRPENWLLMAGDIL